MAPNPKSYSRLAAGALAVSVFAFLSAATTLLATIGGIYESFFSATTNSVSLPVFVGFIIAAPTSTISIVVCGILLVFLNAKAINSCTSVTRTRVRNAWIFELLAVITFGLVIVALIVFFILVIANFRWSAN